MLWNARWDVNQHETQPACKTSHFPSYLCLDKSFPACTSERVRVSTRALRIIRFAVFRRCGLEDYLHFLKQMLIASTFCSPASSLSRWKSQHLKHFRMLSPSPRGTVAKQGQNFGSNLVTQDNRRPKNHFPTTQGRSFKNFLRKLKVKLFLVESFFSFLDWAETVVFSA